MTPAERLILVGICGGLVGLSFVFVVEDWRNRARGNERITCKDEPDTKAYMARLPGEAHTVEHCIQAMRMGSPRWVPDFQNPLKPRREGE